MIDAYCARRKMLFQVQEADRKKLIRMRIEQRRRREMQLIKSIESKDKKSIDLKKDIIKILDSYVNNYEVNKLKEIFSKKRCFIIGNGPSINKIDLSLLNKDITIACNYFMVGMHEKRNSFVPTILCSGDRTCTYHIITRDRNLIRKKNPIVIIHPSNKLFLQNSIKYINHYRSYENIYSICNFNRFKLGKRFIINREFNINMVYCKKYRNVIPMISMLIAEKLGIREIYLLGCDFDNFFTHFYNKNTAVSGQYSKENYQNVYNGFKKRRIELRRKNIKVYNCNPKSKLDIFPKVSFDKII